MQILPDRSGGPSLSWRLICGFCLKWKNIAAVACYFMIVCTRYNKNKYFNSRGKHLWELVKTLYGKSVYDWKGNLFSMQVILNLQSYKFERSDVKMNLVNICTFFGCSLFWFSCCMYIYVYNLLHMLRNNQSDTFHAHVILSNYATYLSSAPVFFWFVFFL